MKRLVLYVPLMSFLLGGCMMIAYPISMTFDKNSPGYMKAFEPKYYPDIIKKSINSGGFAGTEASLAWEALGRGDIRAKKRLEQIRIKFGDDVIRRNEHKRTNFDKSEKYFVLNEQTDIVDYAEDWLSRDNYYYAYLYYYIANDLGKGDYSNKLASLKKELNEKHFNQLVRELKSIYLDLVDEEAREHIRNTR